MISAEVAKKIKPGAVVRVWEKMKDGDKERISKFEGLVLARKHGSEAGAGFTVRATVAAVGVEKVYPLHSPVIDKVEIISTPKKIMRSKLYYIRTVSKKSARQKLSGEKEKAAPVVKPEKKTPETKEIKAETPKVEAKTA